MHGSRESVTPTIVVDVVEGNAGVLKVIGEDLGCSGRSYERRLVGEPSPQNFEEVVLFSNSFLVFFSLK